MKTSEKSVQFLWQHKTSVNIATALRATIALHGHFNPRCEGSIPFLAATNDKGFMECSLSAFACS